MRNVKGEVENKIQKPLLYRMHDRIGNQAWNKVRNPIIEQTSDQLMEQVKQNVKL
jgi:hypothetical protein